MAQWIGGWIRHLTTVRGLASSTVDTYRQHVRSFVDTQDIRNVEQLTYEAIRHHLQRQAFAARSTASSRGFVAAWRSFAQYLMSMGVAVDPAARDVEMPRDYVRQRQPLTKSEVEKLIWVSGRPNTIHRDPGRARRQVMCAVSYHLGLRVSEVVALRREDCDYDPDRHRWSVLIRRAKRAGGDVRRRIEDLPISRLFGNWIAMRTTITKGKPSPWVFPTCLNKPMSTKWANAQLRRHGKDCGVPSTKRRPLSWHIFRRSIATHLIRAGWDLREVQEWMRHRSIQTTARYISVSAGQLANRWRVSHPLKTRRRRGDLDQLARDLLLDPRT